MKILRYGGIDTLLDIGANIGQYGLQMRELGFQGRILSFEPLSSAFQQVSQHAASDTNWQVFNYALGGTDMTTVINIAGNSFSSSLREMLPMHLNTAPQSKYVGQQEIEVKRLDTLFDSLCHAQDKIMMKIDTQGYSKDVLDGAKASLNRIRVIQIETSLVPLYAGEMLFLEMIDYLDALGYQLFSIESDGHSNPTTGQLLQVDSLFVKKDLARQ